jgi:hypothetical protein
MIWIILLAGVALLGFTIHGVWREPPANRGTVFQEPYRARGWPEGPKAR